jgi:F5/8 type C domain/Cellulase (glycosyl hydrolase family 5)
MKRASHFMGCFITCVFLLASCNLPADTSTPTSSPPTNPSPSSVSIQPTVTSIPFTPPEHRIGVRVVNGVGEFYDRAMGEQFVPRGMNYVNLGPQTNPDGETTTYHAVFDPDKYDPLKVSAAMKQMHDDGYNVVRVFLSQNTMGTADDGLSDPYMKNVADFLNLAKQNQIFVMFTQDWLPGGKYGPLINRDCCALFNSMNLNYLSSGGLDANKAFFEDFVQGLIDRQAPLDAIFSYELRNEMFYDTDQPPLSLTQGKITAANGKVYDMASAQDKERMVEENQVYWIDTLREAILAKDPTALVSVGYFHPQKPNPARIGDPRLSVTEPAIWQSQADFIDLHAYPGFELNLKQYVENFGVKDMQQKPILMGEFGGEVSRFPSVDAAAQKFVNWQVESCKYGFDGWLFWTWDDVEEPGFFNALADNGKIEKALAPSTRPDPCSAGTSDRAPTDLALNAAVKASYSLPDQPASNAVDGAFDTQWGSGSGPTQWIEINLGKPSTITTVRLTVAQYPNGSTTHQVWVRGASGDLKLVHEFKGATEDNQTLEFNLDSPLQDIQYIRIVTTQSPSWVSWKEIEVLGK